MLIVEFFIILSQILILYFGVLYFSKTSGFLGRYYGPYNWFAFFSFFWFVIPQLISVFPPYLVVGLEDQGALYRSEMIIHGQMGILAYILSVTIGALIGSKIFKIRNTVDLAIDVTFRVEDYIVLSLFFIVGVFCIFYLGLKFQSMDGMRSELVKDFSGKVFTSFSFFGNFAFSVFFSIFLIRKKYLYSVIVLVIFASAILLTGARGRLLWPVMIALIFLSVYYRKFPILKIFIAGVIMLLVLVMLDPIMISLRTGDFSRLTHDFNLVELFQSLFYRRNFDSFSNLTVIIYFDEVEYSLIRLIEGARDAFMNGYYPAVYDAGVGFGVTYPGTLFLSGGWFTLVLGGGGFGVVLGVIFRFVEAGLGVRSIFAYLFLMPWLAAVGGNFVESFDKMLIAISPAFFWMYFSKFRFVRTKVLDE